MSFFSSLFGGTKTQATQQAAAAGLNVQTSVQGKPVPLIYGVTRVAPNLVWYGDFQAVQQQSQGGGGGGKGGVGGGGGGKGGGGSTGYLYYASFIAVLGEGPLNNVTKVWVDKNIQSLASLNMSSFLGALGQTPWGYLMTNHPAQAIGYSGFAYVAAASYSLGNSPQLPNHNFEVQGFFAGSAGVGTQVTGQQLTTETFTVPGGSSPQVTVSRAASFASDQGITVNSTIAYTAETTSYQNPGLNQYFVQTSYSPAGLLYTFNAGNSGATVNITYTDVVNGKVTATVVIPTGSPPQVVVRGSGAGDTDNGVTATATQLTASASNPPASGKYFVNNGIYTFNSAQAGLTVTISYYYFSTTTSLSIPDADPSLVLTDLLTNAVHGAGFPASRLGSLATWQAYALANGLWISPSYSNQTQASTLVDDLCLATNSALVWSQGVLTVVPYGDQSVTANGYSYTAPTAPLYLLSDDDFLDNGSNSGSSTSQIKDPVVLTCKRQSDAQNTVKLEYLDRANSYNTSIVEVKDSAAINIYGLRPGSVTALHLFCDANAAMRSATLQLQRQSILNQYSFTLDQRYIVLDPMDIVALTDFNLGLNNQWVRILSITENDDLSLSITAEEYLAGTGSAPLYSFQRGLGFEANYNAVPGNANTPVIFEPTAQLGEGLDIWLGVSGSGNWGGADIYISTNGTSYKNIGRVTGNNRTGVLTAALGTVPVNTVGQTIDKVNTLSVDLGQSSGQLQNGSQSDMTSLSTACYVDGEVIAFQNASLVQGFQYNLAPLLRGAYGTNVTSHNAGGYFLRLDSSIFKFTYTPDLIGQTIYVKFVGFNVYGGGQQSLSAVQPYAYTIQGTALSSPLPDVTNLRTSYIANIAQLTWDEVADFRPVLYEVRQGAQWTGARILGRVAHPPFIVNGNGTYWVGVFSQPAAGIQVYSPTPQSLVITGAQITANVVKTWDEAATSWSGTVTGGAGVTGGTVQTVASGNILTDPDYLNTPNILGYGNIASGTYTIPTGHIINVGRVIPCSVLISWTPLGQNLNDNILTVNDYLNFPDLLDYASSAAVNIFPEISVSQDGVTYGPWQKWSPGAYNGLAFNARMQLQITNVNIKAEITSFVFSIDVPARIDHYVNQAIAAVGTTITFTPDGALSAAAFNGGPGTATVPSIQVTLLNPTAGDIVTVSSVSLSSCLIQVTNGGAGVARTVNVLAEGF